MTQKEKENANKSKKGEAAEMYFIETVRLLMSLLGFSLFDMELLNSVILEFQSPYGPKGKMTTEIDCILVTHYLILVIEIKSATFRLGKDLKKIIDKPKWYNSAGKLDPNPVRQNEKHKNFIINLLKDVDPERIIALEVLLGNDNVEKDTNYVNNYILSRDNFKDILKDLLAYEGNNKPMNKRKVVKAINNARSNCSIINHQNNVEDRKKKMRKLKFNKIKETDGVVCLSCYKNNQESHFMYLITEGNELRYYCPHCGYTTSTNKSTLKIVPFSFRQATKNKDVEAIIMRR